MFECPSCGANIKFDPASQQMVCEFCGTRLSPHDHMANKSGKENHDRFSREANMSGEDTEEDFDVYYYTCSQCGGVLMTEETTAATFCSYCGASTILDVRVGKEKKPSYIIPFKKTKEDCAKEYKKIVSKALFAPKSMKENTTIERFRGIYMPYWIYSVKNTGVMNVMGSKSHRSGDYIITDHYRLSSPLDSEYRGITFDASSSFEDRLSEAIAPFNLAGSEHFEKAYLSGFYADTSDVSKEVYIPDAKAVAAYDIAEKTLKGSKYGSYGVGAAQISDAVDSTETYINSDLGMFPVWFLSTRNGDRVSYAVVNGQTGKVAVDIPIDIKKYLIGSLIVSIPLFFLFALLAGGITPKFLLVAIIILAVIMLIIANNQINSLFVRELNYDDKGYNSTKTADQRRETENQLRGKVQVKKTKKKASNSGGIGKIIIGVSIVMFSSAGIFGDKFFPLIIMAYFVIVVIAIITSAAKKNAINKAAKEKVIVSAPASKKAPVIIKPIIAIALSVLIFLGHPANDAWYYGVGIISSILTALTVADLVKQHNMLTSRKLPQFNKRGGEEYE